MHRQIKVLLGHGMGNLHYILEADHKAIKDAARDFYQEEATQKTVSFTKFNGQQWLGNLPLQITRAALEILEKTH